MSRYKLTDILAGKDPGDEWFCLAAPERVWVWMKKSPWPKTLMDKLGVNIVAIKVTSHHISDTSPRKFTKKAPLALNCGVDILKGYIKTTQTKAANFVLRVDSIVELNQAMLELSTMTGFDSWDIQFVEIYNKEHGVATVFSFHNPDGNGTGLYTHRFEINNSWRLYPEVLLSDHVLYIGGFYNTRAHCTAKEIQGVGHGCAIEAGIKSKQVVRRKKK